MDDFDNKVGRIVLTNNASSWQNTEMLQNPVSGEEYHWWEAKNQLCKIRYYR